MANDTLRNARALLLKLVGALALARPGGPAAPALLHRLDPEGALLSMTSDGAFVALLVDADHLAPMPTRINRMFEGMPIELLGNSRDLPVEVVMVGAGAELLAALAPTQAEVDDPERWQLRLHAVALDGAIHHGAGASFGALAATVQAAMAAREAPNAGALRRAMNDAERATGAFVTFSGDVGSSVPWIVVLLMVTIAGVLVLQELWGGCGLTAALVRMGGNQPALTLNGEWWRVWTAGWLHVGFVHALSNLACMVWIAPLLARSLGPSRFVVLYIVCLVGAESVSALGDPDVVGVGASGGVFGLLGALVAATWANIGLMPPQTARSLRWFLLLFALVQIAASFAPHVDPLAHLGGLATGALLVLTRAITVGQSRPWRGESGSRVWGWVMRVAALAALATTGYAAHEAWVTGDPAGLVDPVYVRVEAGDTGVSLLVPKGADRRVASVPGGDFVAFTWGRADNDAVVVTAWLRHLDAPVMDERLAEAVQARLETLTEAKPLEHLSSATTIVTLDGRPWVFLDQDRGKVKLPRWVGFRGDYEVDVQISTDPEARDACTQDVERVVRSVQTR